ncbi:hypothetical protein EC55989_2111 [Escherichia coli 55989]|uniref:Phage holin, lambda family n=2 Tax=Escherichia coli TaxID=562 RepID=B7L7Y5_ECO55|nr:hypothetical protein EC55989_2111 [Escherichia coli 55989]
MRSCADESEGTGRRHRGFALFPVLRHDAGRHRKGAGCQPRTLSAGISGRRAGSGDAGAGEEETRNDSVVGGVAVSTIQTGITEQVIAWLFDHLPTVYAVGAAVSISALMSLYDGRTLVQTVTGSLACGVLAMAVAGSLRFFGFPEDAVTFIGASIGFMGAEKVRDKVIAAFNRRVKEKDE